MTLLQEIQMEFIKEWELFQGFISGITPREWIGIICMIIGHVLIITTVPNIIMGFAEWGFEIIPTILFFVGLILLEAGMIIV